VEALNFSTSLRARLFQDELLVFFLRFSQFRCSGPTDLPEAKKLRTVYLQIKHSTLGLSPITPNKR
jgi:hypothetical protein